MEEQLIIDKTSFYAKIKGFDLDVTNYFQLTSVSGGFVPGTGIPQNINALKSASIFSRPSQSVLQRWLRDKHNLHIYIRYCFSENDYVGHVYDSDTNTYQQVKDEFDEGTKRYQSYEACLEELLLEALNRIEL